MNKIDWVYQGPDKTGVRPVFKGDYLGNEMVFEPWEKYFSIRADVFNMEGVAVTNFHTGYHEMYDYTLAQSNPGGARYRKTENTYGYTVNSDGVRVQGIPETHKKAVAELLQIGEQLRAEPFIQKLIEYHAGILEFRRSENRMQARHKDFMDEQKVVIERKETLDGMLSRMPEPFRTIIERAK